MGLSFKEDVEKQNPFSELQNVKEISRKEMREGHAVSVEFIFATKNGEESFFTWNGMDYEHIPQTLAEAIEISGGLLPVVPGGVC
jgi:hypothetical protein